ncbi:MAG: hypothetical protein ABI794_03935 [Betaproteobacteria bacterium]
MRVLRNSLAAAAMCVVAAGCNLRESVRALEDSRSATIPQSLLGAVPCLTRNAEARFGVTPAVDEDASQWIVRITLDLPATAEGPAQLRYELRSKDGKTTRVRYEVEASAARARTLEAEAFDPVERCAGTRIR